MTTFWGADTEALRAHADLLRDRASSITELRDTLAPRVNDESIWVGPDADVFRSSWTARSAAIDAAVAALSGRGDALDAEADQQDEVSEADAGGGTEGSKAGPDTWFQDILDGIGNVWNDFVNFLPLQLYNAAQTLFTRAKKVWDIARILRGVGVAASEGLTAVEQLGKLVWSGKEEFSGLANRLLGKLNIPTAFGTHKFFSWIDPLMRTLGETAPWIGRVTPWIGKALPGIDVLFGGIQLIDSLQKGDTFHAVTGGAQVLGGSLMLAGGIASATGVGAVVGGPLVLAGGIISGAAALADLGKLVYDNWDSISATAADVWEGATDVVGDVVDGIGGAWNSVFG